MFDSIGSIPLYWVIAKKQNHRTYVLVDYVEDWNACIWDWDISKMRTPEHLKFLAFSDQERAQRYWRVYLDGRKDVQIVESPFLLTMKNGIV